MLKNQKFTNAELALSRQIIELKNQAGSHSPSIFTYKQKLPEINIKVDACFLSNPYATDLFLEYFNEEIINTEKIRDLLEFYPSQNSVIAELLANFLKIEPDNVFIGNGAIEIIQAIIHNFTVKKIIINIPTFSSYYEFAKEGVEVVFNVLKKENQYNLITDTYIELVKKERPDTIVLINPNNPNGAFLSSKETEKLLTELSFVNTIILDESFIHFAYEDNKFEMVSMAKLIDKFPNLIVLKSMSKDFGIAGVRAGYGIMSKERVHKLLTNGYLWNSNGLAEYFFRLYTRTDFAYNYNQVRVKYIIETLEFIKELETIPNIKIYPSKANFVLVELLNGINSNDFVAFMLIRYGIYVRTCDDKIGLEGQYIRLASRSKTENEYIIKSFREFLGK
jgi:histidinol-phosphate/aromatic aminotransferase/cobyric acid decarboxylase-like protein